MNIYEYLKRDHAVVKKLFEKIYTFPQETSQDLEERSFIFEELVEEFFLHSDAEEKTFYNTLKKEGELKDKIQHAITEHEEVKNLIETINKLDVNDKIWLDKIKELEEEIQHHVQEEEQEMFSQAKKVLTEEQEQNLAKEMDKLKEENKAMHFKE